MKRTPSRCTQVTGTTSAAPRTCTACDKITACDGGKSASCTRIGTKATSLQKEALPASPFGSAIQCCRIGSGGAKAIRKATTRAAMQAREQLG